MTSENKQPIFRINQLGPRQQFIGTNGRKQKLVSKKAAWRMIELQRAQAQTTPGS